LISKIYKLNISHYNHFDNSKKKIFINKIKSILKISSRKIYSSIIEEIEKLKYRFVITTTLTCFSLFGMLYLLGRTLIRWKRIQQSLQTVFRRDIKVKVRLHKNRSFRKECCTRIDLYTFLLQQIFY